MTLHRWTVEADAVNDTDAAIVAEVLAGAVRDERNNPDEAVAVAFAPVPDTAGDERRRVLELRLRLAREAAAGPLGTLQRRELSATIAELEAELAAGDRPHVQLEATS